MGLPLAPCVAAGHFFCPKYMTKMLQKVNFLANCGIYFGMRTGIAKFVTHLPNIITNMTTQEVANRFYELAQQGQFDQILGELFSQDAKSIEPAHAPWQTVQGLDKIIEKGKSWHEMTEEMHGGYTTEPKVAGNFFTCTMGMDVTIKGQGRMKMDEVAVYEVKDGKIVSEQFFF
jgi:hypothetical protein